MATATIAPGIDVLERESKALEAELVGLRDKVAAEQRTLAHLTEEREKLIREIGLKREKPSKMIEVAAEIAGSESVIEGLNALIRPKQSRLDEVLTQLRFRREAGQRAAELAEIVNLRHDGEAIAKRIAASVAAMRSDLDAYFAILQRLGRIPGHAALATASAANECKRHLDKTLADILTPFFRLMGK
jgi:small-conductance mechanosensitive channel